MSAGPDIHELVAPYALGALLGPDRSLFERHLGECPTCALELPGLEAAAAALALDAQDLRPPQSLRGRIVEAAQRERAPIRIEPARSTFRFRLVPVLAAAACLAAVALGVWALRLSGELDGATAARRAEVRAASILADPSAARFRLRGANGVLAVTKGREAALLVSRLPRAVRSKTYEAWVVDGAEAKPAGTFAGGAEAALLALERRVPSGAHVSVSLEPAGGSSTLTGPLLFGTEAT